MRVMLRSTLCAALLGCLSAAASANVIADWDARLVAFVTPRLPPPSGQRMVAMAEIAMFEAVNAITPRYRSTLTPAPAKVDASLEAAAAAAAGTVMAAHDSSGEAKKVLDAYLAGLPDGTATTDGVTLGTQIATRILELRAKDGSTAPDAYRPKTKPGIYIPTAPTFTPMWPEVTPFTMASPAAFRPAPPVALTSTRWAADYNEIKELGGRNSNKRTAQQTEEARFWLMIGPQSNHPVARQLVLARKLDVVDAARFMAVIAAAMADSYIAVMEAKYHYEFWRPVTAIRNGDQDGNDATERDASWLPIDQTPMHPEYPCAHCIASATVAAAIEALLGTAEVGEISMTSVTAPGVTHRWSNVWAYADEVARARIFAGFHYRFSAEVGTMMGRQIGQQAAATFMLPLSAKRAGQ
jgi:hypothetical protein